MVPSRVLALSALADPTTPSSARAPTQIPSKAAAIYDGKTTPTYSDQANVHRRSGGRINAAGLHFLSRVLPLKAEGTPGLTRV